MGRRFVDLLAEKARQGVAVRVLYDWFGCGLGPLFGLFRPLMEAGADVRVFNPPSITAALGWLRRNHRKLHRRSMAGSRSRAASASVRRGKACPQAAGAVARYGRRDHRPRGGARERTPSPKAGVWRAAGRSRSRRARRRTPPAGTVNLRLIPTEPFTANLLRLDLLITTMARRRCGSPMRTSSAPGPYLEALKRAAHDGVDVRLLLPRGSDVRWTVPVSRSLYRPLLEAGVRIFEWNGTMVHAKTAVADSRWARIGSTNLNLNSWMGNWELDVAIEERSRSAETMEAHYEEDLGAIDRNRVDPPARIERAGAAAALTRDVVRGPAFRPAHGAQRHRYRPEHRRRGHGPSVPRAIRSRPACGGRRPPCRRGVRRLLHATRARLADRGPGRMDRDDPRRRGLVPAPPAASGVTGPSHFRSSIASLMID